MVLMSDIMSDRAIGFNQFESVTVALGLVKIDQFHLEAESGAWRDVRG